MCASQHHAGSLGSQRQLKMMTWTRCNETLTCRFGSGLEGEAFTQEFTCLLAALLEPAGTHPWLTDWLWGLYRAVLQPFLALAGPASDGTAVTRFREYWQSLPWHKATFHCISPGAQLGGCSLLTRQQHLPP